uniref:Uncharacterized protein n=1 Tax=Myotis myotis TaxID=51298 RepID=A0A7J7VI85_MYOMY|nr:hypothetical protein mMyoMyo1_008328 [Myotis myotis]
MPAFYVIEILSRAMLAFLVRNRLPGTWGLGKQTHALHQIRGHLNGDPCTPKKFIMSSVGSVSLLKLYANLRPSGRNSCTGLGGGVPQPSLQPLQSGIPRGMSDCPFRPDPWSPPTALPCRPSCGHMGAAILCVGVMVYLHTGHD